MKNNLRLWKLIMVFAGSIIAIILMIINREIYTLVFSGQSVDTTFFNILSIFTISTTILSIMDIKKRNKNKLWLFLILFGSFVGNLVYSSVQLLLILKEKRYEIA